MKAKGSSASNALRTIARQGMRPVNWQAARGVHGSNNPLAPIPEGGIDCSKWNQVKIERFFRDRYPWLGLDSVSRLVKIAMLDGRIEGKPKYRRNPKQLKFSK